MISRVAFRIIVLGLMAGFGLLVAGQPELAVRAFALTMGLMLVLPVVNVVIVLADEVRRRDWTFVAIAIAVLLLGFSIIDRVMQQF